MSSAIFINLPVQDPKASGEFFTKIGFAPDEEFTGGDVVSVLIGENIRVFLVTEAFFRQASRREVADTATHAEVELAVQVESRACVNEIADAAAAAGGEAAGEHEEPGVMYSRGFRDLDGHLWNVFSMNATS
ncbi:VOC family protein [Nonomuraea diastatica]|uniref:VOC domain-containing protein n=1 Tax=Nonomuraea diastatica TaxID=1848329 RepID=A0A4R4WMQ6_9ACTN|nr:VOC family protein [Nonomuraea diastatica]TDD18024.1 hypothetical protein E1294_25790 [Nonomuraea diastatica]